MSFANCLAFFFVDNRSNPILSRTEMTMVTFRSEFQDDVCNM